ncbi:MAG: hypothetical protein A2X17_07745 [Bacteroidetes bacterium GWF2_41_61]|jgi:hypothetical protein|nr:MAG: hypothetical protein A2X20_12015 [Bacteroidetes bacterium GWE2_40_15]OFY30088.1 MAG: hypothetical protein A2X17_07745 [Bacteroidetes bacterium GWF2_41_61]PKP05750.1 MAG: hypothetical protein CVU10_10400 [Bacteroidetes bacterium HGW-Bacteroidetes-5]HBZ24994.1 hypothetical protein [Rikenellaceae bacterium]
MKKIFITTLLIFTSVIFFGQAKKPTIMVMPSDQYCLSRGFKLTFTNQGMTQTLPDYRAAMQSDPNLRLVITKMGQMMADRGFPLKDLEAEMRNMMQESAESSMLTSSSSGSEMAESPIDVLKRVAKADIILDLDFDLKAQGPSKYMVFNLRGLDAYTAKQVSGVAGAGRPSTSATPEILMEEAVLSHMDSFNAGLMRHFDDLFENGREVKVLVKVFNNWGENLESEFESAGETKELSFIIEDWFADNCVKGRFNLSDATENQMRFEQVRIPVMKLQSGRERAVDTRSFVSDLRKHLTDKYQIQSKLYLRGLGEAWLILGEK